MTIERSSHVNPSWWHSNAGVMTQAADCAAATGKFLVVCREGTIVPISEAGPLDDPGMSLAASLWTYSTRQALGERDVLWFDLAINLIGIYLLAVFLILCGARYMASVAAIFLPVLLPAFVEMSPHPSQLGLTAAALCLPCAIIYVFGRRRRWPWRWLAIPVLGSAFLLAVVVTLFRQPLGFLTFAVSLGVLVMLLVRLGLRGTWVRLSLSAIVLAGVLLAPKAIFRLRDVAYGLKPSSLVEQHGTWHALFLGLGYVENPFGIKWLDSVGVESAAAVDPTATYGTARYLDTLRREYVAIVLDHPATVLRIYGEKLWIALTTPLPIGETTNGYLSSLHVPIAGVVVLLLVLTVVTSLRLPLNVFRRLLPLAVIVLGSVLFFLLQASLIAPDFRYLFPIEVPLTLWVGLLLESWARARPARIGLAGVSR
jgi:hypothetical protein